MIEKWKPLDIISLVIVVGTLTLLHRGIDSFVSLTLLGVVLAYYGVDIAPFLKLGRIRKEK